MIRSGLVRAEPLYGKWFIVWLMLQCVICCGIFATPAFAQQEEIESFSADLIIDPNGQVLVDEQITVRALGRSIKHGIYRDIPTTYRDQFGVRRKVSLDVISITRDGRPERYTEEAIFGGFGAASGRRMKIGKKEVTLDTGLHTYGISYRMSGAIGYFDDHDEIFWNVTGNGWKFPIRNAKAVIHLPPGVRSDVARTGGYVGTLGAREHSFRSEWQSPEAAEFWTTRALDLQEGFSVYVEWPKGFVAEPTQQEKFQGFLKDNLETVIGLVGVLCCVVYFFIAWSLVGRDPRRGTIIPMFTAPEGLSPSDVRFLWKMGYDNKAFSVAIVHLAVQGYLRIHHPEGLPYELEQISKDEPIAQDEEAKLYEKLFAAGSKVVLQQGNHSRLQAARNALIKSLKVQHLKTHILKNSSHFVVGALLSIATIVMSVLALPMEQMPFVFFLGVWLTIWSIGVFSIVRSAIQAWAVYRAGMSPFGVIGIILLWLFAIPFIAAELGALYALFHASSLGFVVICLLLAVIDFLFYHLMKAPTVAGRSLLDQIEGLRMYLGTAESDRLGALYPVKKTPEHFEEFLPYAMALDVEVAWGEKFSQGLDSASAQTSASGSRASHSFSWYDGGAIASLNTFSSSMGSSFSSALAQSSSSPSSSGGSSGGSGGGGGGGGGGGW